MRRLLLLTTLLMLLVARPAHGQSGINLSWSDCGSNGAFSRTFACDTNSGTQTLVASFVSGVDLNQLTGIAGVIDLCTMTPVLPSWWQMKNPGTCRPNALSVDFDFTSGPGNCADYWQGQAVGGIHYAMGAAWGFNGARILTVAAIPGSAVSPLDGETEYYAFRITIRNDASTGAGACSGCGEPACIVLNSVELTQPAGVGDYFISSPYMSYYVQWQGPVFDCPFVVPTRAPSWGQIKAMYR